MDALAASNGYRHAPGRPTRGQRRLLAAGAVVAAVAVTLYLLAFAVHPSMMTRGFDLHIYMGGAGEALHHEAAIYSYKFENDPGLRFDYTPFAAVAMTVGLAVPFTVLYLLVAAMGVAALVVTVWIALRELGWRRRALRLGATLLLSGLFLWSQPVQRALHLGQVELVLMVLVVWDLCQPDRRWLKGAGTGIAAGIKLVPLLFIVYLLVTRRFRQAAVAIGAFVATMVIGFIAAPSASVTWWVHATFLKVSRMTFAGEVMNQSLRAMITRFSGSSSGFAVEAWLAVSVVVVAAGLAAAAALHHRGATFAGLMMTALTALLVSPISWDNHWVWIAPFLVVLVDAGARAAAPATRAAWYALAGLLYACDFSWPDFWRPTDGLLEGGLIRYPPSNPVGFGDKPWYAEYHWNALQALAGNVELLVGIVLFAILLAMAWRRYRPGGDGRSSRRSALDSVRA